MSAYPRLKGSFDLWNVLCSLSYWVIWLVMAANGHTWLGMLVGALVSVGGMTVLWKYTWGEWWPTNEDDVS